MSGLSGQNGNLPHLHPCFPMALNFPPELRYTDSHEYLRSYDDGTATVGITAYAVDQLGDIVFVELPEVGAILNGEASFGTVESVKAVEELHMPVAGTVLARNEAVLSSPEALQQDPYGEGWLLKLKPEAAANTDQLLSAADYAARVGEG